MLFIYMSIEVDKSIEEIMFLAQLAEQCERYDDMVYYIKLLAYTKKILTFHERNTLALAYKNAITSQRNAWRTLETQLKTTDKKDISSIQRIKSYQKTIETEILSVCNDAFKIIDEVLLPNSKSSEDTVFFLKMKGDYQRYVCEISSDDIKINASTIAHEAYQKAYETACETMTPTHPLRLGVLLNFTVLYYDIFLKQDKACEMAKKGFDEAISNLDNAKDDINYKDSTVLLQLLRDNLTLWTSDAIEESK